MQERIAAERVVRLANAKQSQQERKTLVRLKDTICSMKLMTIPNNQRPAYNRVEQAIHEHDMTWAIEKILMK